MADVQIEVNGLNGVIFKMKLTSYLKHTIHIEVGIPVSLLVSFSTSMAQCIRATALEDSARIAGEANTNVI